MEFIERYGPWAVIAGASEGIGQAYARQLAAKGLSLILIARRQAPLDTLAQEIRNETGVECITASIDLGLENAHKRIAETVGNREVGLYLSNAGADPNGSHFLDKEFEAWRSLVSRNILTSMQCCHYFGRKMRERGRGGLLLINSYACYTGASHLATYSGSKAFELCFAEGLWSELKPHGVDVLTVVMGMTDTPAFRQLLDAQGLPLPPGTASPEEVAAFGLANLANGPVQNWGLAEDEAGAAPQSAADRRARIGMVEEFSRRVFSGE